MSDRHTRRDVYGQPDPEGGRIGFVAYSPLARGFVTGAAKPADRYDTSDARNAGIPWFQPGNCETNTGAVEQLTELAASNGATISTRARVDPRPARLHR